MKIQEERSLKIIKIGLDSNTVEIFNPTFPNPVWDWTDPLEFERKNFSVSLAYYRAIIIGGRGKVKKNLTEDGLSEFQTLDDNEVISYDEKAKKFSTKSFYELVKPRHSHSSIVLKNQRGEDQMLYVFGGFTEDDINGKKYAETFERIDLIKVQA